MHLRVLTNDEDIIVMGERSGRLLYVRFLFIFYAYYLHM